MTERLLRLAEVEIERLLYRPIEVGYAIGACRSTVYELIKSGMIPSVKIGGLLRVPRRALEKWIEDQQVATGRE